MGSGGSNFAQDGYQDYMFSNDTNSSFANMAVYIGMYISLHFVFFLFCTYVMDVGIY